MYIKYYTEYCDQNHYFYFLFKYRLYELHNILFYFIPININEV